MNNTENQYTSPIKQIESGKMSTSLAWISAALLLLFSPIWASEYVKRNNTPEKIKQRAHNAMCSVLKKTLDNETIHINQAVSEYQAGINQRYAEHILGWKEYTWEEHQLREAKKDSLQCMKESLGELKNHVDPVLSWNQEDLIEVLDLIDQQDLLVELDAQNESIQEIQKEIDAVVFLKR